MSFEEQMRWSPLLGEVSASEFRHEPRVMHLTLTCADGRRIPIAFDQIAVGPPAIASKLANKRLKKAPPMTNEDRRWITIWLKDGQLMAFRDAAPDVSA